MAILPSGVSPAYTEPSLQTSPMVGLEAHGSGGFISMEKLGVVVVRLPSLASMLSPAYVPETVGVPVIFTVVLSIFTRVIPVGHVPRAV